MNTSRLGCLSPLALISALITLVILILAEIISGNSMFNPGELNAQAGTQFSGVTSHAGTGKDCGQCHVPFWSTQTMSDRCMACHTDIPSQIEDPTSLHGILLQGAVRACQNCHTEHHGPEASLTLMDMVGFPHEQTGFSLAGHQARKEGGPFACIDCHPQGISTFESQTCIDCHRTLDPAFTEAHLLDFGEPCLTCHDGVDRYGDFDHSQLSFPLNGQHLEVSCSACHPGARTISDLQGTPTECEACHQSDDAHAGRFGSQCGACHNPAAWSPAKFNHNLAKFRLVGKHVEVPCESCHITGYQGTPIECEACHLSDDAHNGRFGTQCGTCHTPAGWSPAEFDHNLADFKLEGKHVDVPCESCHTQGFQGTPMDCYSCHQQDDQHAGRFGTDCAACHNPSDWADATFDHNLASFRLTGAHVNVICTDCHVNGIFKGTPQVCSACHYDPPFHAGLFSGMSCSQCHNTSNWNDASFNLAHPSCGERNCINHEGANCRDCHTESLARATCLKCHDSNTPGDGGDGGGGDG
jgi:hypothetical protein